MTVQRVVQGLVLTLFAALLGAAALPWLPTDLFLRLDPAALLSAALAARAWVPGLGWALLMLALTVLLGRFFCGYMCPLGTTIDLADHLLRQKRPRAAADAAPRRFKYGVLLFLLAAAGLGVSFVVFAAPLPLVTRLYGLVVLPAARLLLDSLLAAAGPLAGLLDLTGLTYAQVATPRYALAWFSAGLAALILALAWLAPRFWCRALCPGGALFALCARRPVVARRVDAACIDCGQCRKDCPMGAVGEDPRTTDTAECLVCRTCARVCPVDAVSFGAARATPVPFSLPRRTLLKGGLVGAGAAAVTLVGAEHLLGPEGPGRLVPASLIRPPGSVREAAFLSRCLRCGACMAACPTNTLQPLALAAGVAALFSPVVTARRGPCDPHCTRCGEACPTGAIRALTPAERLWAKVGTAHVLRHQCLAWEYDRRCLVCDEVCPYGAVTLRRVEGLGQPVPFVDERRCSGCGYCEYHCPVTAAKAIVVDPNDALRLDRGSFRAAGRGAGLSLELKAPAHAVDVSLDAAGPAFEGLPPGFSD